MNYVITTGSNPGAPVTYGHFGPTAQAPYTISGTVRDAQNQPVSGVTVTLSGGTGGQVTTGGNGQYSFTNLQSGDYTLTPSKSGFVFNPSSITCQNLQKSKTGADFTALPPIQTIYDKKVNYAYNAVGALAGVGTNLIGSDPKR